MMAAWKLSPPLATGCTMVPKPSELTPLSSLKLAGILAGVYTKGVVNVISGRGATTVDALISHEKIEFVSVTGSIRTASRVLEAAAKTIRHTHLVGVSEMPHGSIKSSGYGKDMSMCALEDYTVPRHVMIAH